MDCVYASIALPMMIFVGLIGLACVIMATGNVVRGLLGHGDLTALIPLVGTLVLAFVAGYGICAKLFSGWWAVNYCSVAKYAAWGGIAVAILIMAVSGIILLVKTCAMFSKKM